MPEGNSAAASSDARMPTEDERGYVAGCDMREAAPKDSRARKWLARLQASRHAMALLFFASFAETIIVPIPIEVILIPFMLANRHRIWWIATVTFLGCVVGALLGYGVGYLFFDTFGASVMQAMGWEQAYQQFQNMFDQHGFWAVVAIGVVPIPFQVAMLAAGAAHYSIPLFVLATALARGVRYYGLAALVLWLGPRALKAWREHKILASLVAVVVLAALWGLMQLIAPGGGGGGSGAG